MTLPQFGHSDYSYASKLRYKYRSRTTDLATSLVFQNYRSGDMSLGNTGQNMPAKWFWPRRVSPSCEPTFKNAKVAGGGSSVSKALGHDLVFTTMRPFWKKDIRAECPLAFPKVVLVQARNHKAKQNPNNNWLVLNPHLVAHLLVI